MLLIEDEDAALHCTVKNLNFHLELGSFEIQLVNEVKKVASPNLTFFQIFPFPILALIRAVFSS